MCHRYAQNSMPGENTTPPPEQETGSGAQQIGHLARSLLGALGAGGDSSLWKQDVALLHELQEQLKWLLPSLSASPRRLAPLPQGGTGPGTLSTLPDALLLQSLAFLDVPGLIRAMLCSRALRALSVSSPVWRPLSLCRWPWLGAREEDLPTYSPDQEGFAYYEAFRRREAARVLATQPRAPHLHARFGDYELCVDLRHVDSGELFYSAREALDDSFPVSIFEFSGWELQPWSPVVSRRMLFGSMDEVRAFFGEGGPLRMDFSLVDRKRRLLAELSTRSEVAPSVRCVQGHLGGELWVFACPDATFLGGALRLLRGLTVIVRREGDAVLCTFKNAWVCDHQYLELVDRPVTVQDVARVLREEVCWA